GAAPLACIWPLRFSVLGRPRKVISARSCVKARPRSARCCAALTPARSDWASRRKPTVSLDVISLVASSCGYYRGQIEQRAAHEFAVHVATQRGLAKCLQHRHSPRAPPVALLRERPCRRPRLTPRSGTAQAP